MPGGAAARLSQGAAEILGRPLAGHERDLLLKYLDLLVKWQRSQRLVGSAEPAWIVENVLLDSLLFTRILPDSAREVIDVGSGAGVPGIPLKVVRRQISMTLLESRGRRASFLAAVVRELALDGCRVLNARLEDVGAELAGRFDAAVVRCAGDPGSLLGALRPVLKPEALVIASGPPRPRPVAAGAWREVSWSGGRRLFWVHGET